MGLGILEDPVLEHVPGTTKYFDDPAHPRYAADGATGLKCDTSGPVPIILVPQPSDDPNDPLNWPLWKRDLITFLLSTTAVFGTALGPILAPETLLLSLWMGKPVDNIARLTGYFLLGVGVAGFFFIASSRIWGKRHLFVLGTVILVASSAWAGASGKNYKSFLWARIFQGIGTAPFEALVNAAVGDLYCVHQRGTRMAFTNLAVFGGAFFCPVLAGKITMELGWWWSFYFVAIFTGVCLPFIVFFCPETAYRRDRSLNLDFLATDNPAEDASSGGQRSDAELRASDQEKGSGGGGGEGGGPNNSTESARALSKAVPPKATFWQSVALFNGRKSDEVFWRLLLRPLPLFLQPAFFWSCLIQGTLIAWTVFVGVILGLFLQSTPLWWDPDKTGYAYVAGFIGALVGFAIVGLLADWSARKLTRWNRGVYEPEFRILLTVPQLVLGCAGLYGFGITADGIHDKVYSYPVPLTFFGLVVAAMVVGAVAGSLYIVDAYRELAVEAFTCMIIFKNLISFGLTYKAYTWLVTSHRGTAKNATPLFRILFIIQLIIGLSSIPMYVFGKRIRGFFYRHSLVKFFEDKILTPIESAVRWLLSPVLALRR
ncbi:hypothetical protein VTK73DRAFT_5642 [Phialemonium thermophilum]|uniref:Major facilitator superfamily (MFS) profile domain-containing protein n=1 Tax=Phialemonium thermophilum TaxID=223376 RepID=A0ABR3WMD0_9PEZI